jgi:outer membrane protein
MRVATFRSLLVTAVLLLGGTAAAAQDLRIAVVDLDQAINATDQGKKASEELKKKQKAAQAQLQPLIDKGRALANEIQEKRFVLSEDALYQKQLDLAEIQNEVRSKGAALEGQWKVDYERLVGPMRQKLLDIVKEIGKDQGFTLIFERGSPGLLYAREALDITDQVIKNFNKKN